MKKIEQGSGNVYADLAYPDAAQMQIKAQLAARIGELILGKKLTQIQAAGILGIPQPKLSGLLRGAFRGVSEAKMLECLSRLGQDVEIVVRKSGRAKSHGTISVVVLA